MPHMYDTTGTAGLSADPAIDLASGRALADTQHLSAPSVSALRHYLGMARFELPRLAAAAAAAN
jgi:hypothetical protein